MNHQCRDDGCSAFMWGECVIKQAERNRNKTATMTEAVRGFKAAILTGDHEAERELAKELHELGHPDVRGLAMAVKTSGATAPKKARRADL